MKTERKILMRAMSLVLLHRRAMSEIGTMPPGITREELAAMSRELCVDLGCDNELTEEEYAFLFSTVGSVSKETAFNFVDQYEAVHPLLWSMNLMEGLRNYDATEKDTFNGVLKACDVYGIDTVASADYYSLRPIEEIEKQKAIAGIWCIRAAFMNDKRFLRKHRSAQKLFTELLAPQYRGLVQEIPHRKGVLFGDFVVKNKPLYAFTDEEFGDFDTIAVGRYRALDWVTSDKEWGDFEFLDHMFVFRASKQQ